MKTWTKLEPEVREVFEYLGMRVQCVEDDPYDSRNCTDCAFHGRGQCDTIYCAEHERVDEKCVHFIKLQKPRK